MSGMDGNENKQDQKNSDPEIWFVHNSSYARSGFRQHDRRRHRKFLD
jgi:hypothetical protein